MSAAKRSASASTFPAGAATRAGGGNGVSGTGAAPDARARTMASSPMDLTLEGLVLGSSPSEARISFQISALSTESIPRSPSRSTLSVSRSSG